MSKSSWKVPGYVVERPLGHGGSGEVWLGRVARSGASVALKRLPMTAPSQFAAARNEAAVLSALEHPHLVRLHELVRVDGAVVLVLDLADAGSLADLLRRRTKLTPGEVVTALAPIGTALAYAHSHGIVHGDVSAANVLFTSIGLPLLADLGLARIIGDEGAAPAHSTPAYIDPTVANGYLPGTATDVFSLAAVAVHALRGRPLWPGSQATEMIDAAAAAHRKFDLDVLLPATPEAVRAVLARALDLVAQRRSTAAEFALDLRHSLSPIPVELRAGRVGRHAASSTAEVADAQAAAASDSVQSGLLTYGRQLPPFQPPSHKLRRLQLARSRRSVRRPSRHWLGIGALSATAAVALTGLFVAWPATGATGSNASSGAPSSAPSQPARSTTSTRSTANAIDPVIVDAASAAAVLSRLDLVREQAFAQRDPTELALVYSPGELLEQDTATLDELVAPGCVLTGARTDYRSVLLVAATGGAGTSKVENTVQLLASASLAPSVLTCGGSISRNVGGIASAALQIELTRMSSGRYVINALAPQ